MDAHLSVAPLVLRLNDVVVRCGRCGPTGSRCKLLHPCSRNLSLPWQVPDCARTEARAESRSSPGQLYFPS